jgi:surfeit locus 1 family protein
MTMTTPAPGSFKPPLAATAMMMIGLVVLIQLGQWQMDRLRWKNDLIAAIETAYQADPQNTPLTRTRLETLKSQGIVFDYGTVRGTYLHAAEIAIGPRTHQGKPGYHIITPLRLADATDTLVLVNRGWVPLDQAQRLTRADTRHRAASVIIGTVRAIPKPNPMTPANDPARDQWFQIDPAQIAAHFKLDASILDHVMIYAESETPSFPLPVAHEKGWMPENNHLGYALFWFGMALVLVVIYGIRFWGIRSRTRRKQAGEL